jgi:hypothetical protein
MARIFKTARAGPRSLARMTRIVIPFEIEAWEETVYEEPGDGPRLAQVRVVKRFSGALEGTSEARVLTAQGPGGAGYLASERVEGTLDGRRGTFVLQHGGVGDSTAQRAFGHIVPGSGTGELAALAGEAEFAHDESGARVTLTISR